MDADIYIEVLKTAFTPYLKSMRNFHFSFSNPLFLVFLLALLLILLRHWGHEKSLSFCLIIAAVLCSTSTLEAFFIAGIRAYGQIFDPLLLRLLALTIIGAISIGYLFVLE